MLYCWLKIYSAPFEFARFQIIDNSRNIIYSEYSGDSPDLHIRLPMCTSFDITNPEEVEGKFIISHNFPIVLKSYEQHVTVSSLESEAFKETVSGNIVSREYHLVGEEKEGILELNLKGRDVLSIMLNNEILFEGTSRSIQKEFHLVIPAKIEQQSSLVISYHLGEMEVSARWSDRMVDSFILYRRFVSYISV